MKRTNPFVIVGYEGPEYFCDRAEETSKIIDAVKNGRNLTLIAPRRYGKTGLLHNAYNSLGDDYIKIYIDIFATRNLNDFTKTLASAVVGAIDTPIEKAMLQVGKFFKSCRPTILPQENGMPKFSFDIAPQQTETTLKEIFEYLKDHKGKVVIAIDEFQQILEYPEKGTEALLRSYVQNVPWVRFLFSGSRHHLMGEMFLSSKHPFYQSTDILSLPVIKREKYAEFASCHFAKAGHIFNREVFNVLYDRFRGVTWYIQMLLNRIWGKQEGLKDVSQITDVINEMVAERAFVFRDLYFSQNESCQLLLLAIAREGTVKSMFSSEFISRNALKATSTVRSALKNLENSELVYHDEKGYVIYDQVFAQWLIKYLDSH